MDISKLSRHTKKAKKLIALALGLGENALAHFGPEEKKIMINISSSGKIIDTINKILGNRVQKIKKIKVNLVANHICGKDGAAKILANSMLTKNKKNKENEAGFKNLVSKTLETLSEDSFNDEKKNEDIRTKMRSYIKQKKRGVLSIQYSEEGSEAKSGSDREENGAAEIVKDDKSIEDSKDAREIDWLKLLCALMVLYVIKAKEEEERKRQEELKKQKEELKKQEESLRKEEEAEEEEEVKEEEAEEEEEITDKSKTLITREQIDDANKFIREKVTAITKESTTFYKLKSEFETILQRDEEKLSILQPLLRDIEFLLNEASFAVTIELLIKVNKLTDDSIYEDTKTALRGFLEKAQKLASERSGDSSEEIETKKQIDGANEFIKERVTAITETSTTFYELKSKFETILQRDAKKLSILRPLLKDIGIRLNKTTFDSVPIELLIATNKDSIYEDTKTALSDFLKKAKELASKRSGDPSEEMSQLISDIDKGREEQLIIYLKDKIEIEKIRTVGNVNDTVTQKYVISQDGTELIIYPSLKNKDFLYVVEYLCKIENDLIKGSDYANKRGDFPESKLYDIDKHPVGLFKPDLLNAKTRVRLLLKWEDFLKEELTCVNSKYEYKTYGQIIEMNKDDRDKLFGELNKEITQCVEQLNGIGIQKIRTVGNVNDIVPKKYVISKGGTELIIYSSFEKKDFLYVFEHLCKIGDDSIKDIDCLGEEHRFPESKLYTDINECPAYLLRPDLIAVEINELLLKWEDFLKETVSYVNSQDESKEYTYKRIIEMKKDERNKLFGELYEIEKLRQEVKKN